MKIVQIPQGSIEWHAMRRIRIGASNSPALVGVHPYKCAIDVYEEMVSGKRAFINKAMQHGMDTEAQARHFFIWETCVAYTPEVVINDKYPHLMASLDGLSVNKREILEIKCPQDETYLQCSNGKIPLHWEYQIQHQLLISEAERAHLFIWKDENSHIHLIYTPDDKKQAEILKACNEFYDNHLMALTPPPRDTEYVERYDEKFQKLVSQYQLIVKERKLLEEAEKSLNEQIVALCEDKPTKGLGVRIERNMVKGSVEYSKIPELNGVDLDAYRKPSTIRWRICETKETLDNS